LHDLLKDWERWSAELMESISLIPCSPISFAARQSILDRLAHCNSRYLCLVLVASKARANAKPNSPLRSLATPSSISRKFLALLLALFFETVFPLPIFFESATPSRSTASNLTTEKLPTAA